MSAAARNAHGREQNRSLNQSAVLAAIHRHGQISRIDLARELRLSAAAVSAITGALIEAGLVVEAELGTSASVGRKPILLEIDYQHAFLLGVKVAATAVTTALTNLKAEPLAVRTDPLQSLGAGDVMSAIQGAAGKLLASAGLSVGEVAGVGVSLPGIVEQQTGNVRYSPLLDWYQVPFAEALGDRLGLPVLVENDVNALAAAQSWFGHGQRHQSFLVLTLGRGVGLGIVTEGRLYRGPRGGAGEVGHTWITPVDPQVMPGRASTLERLLADGALIQLARSIGVPLDADASPERLTELAESGEKLVLALFDDVGRTLGLATANLVNVFAPSLVVLSGEGVRNARFFLPAVRAALREWCFGDLSQELELVVDDWGDDAWARGAAGIAAARFLAEGSVHKNTGRGLEARP